MSSQKSRLQHRQGTAAAWAAANPVLLAGEFGFETDTKILRCGDGISTFTSLTPIGTLQQMGGQPVNANLTSLANLTLAAGKGLYATGPETVAMFDLTAAGLAILDDADTAAQRQTLGLGGAIAQYAGDITDANEATSQGFYRLVSPWTNGPTAATHRIIVTGSDANSLVQIVVLASPSANAIWYRQRASGVWGAWVRITDPAALRSELNAAGDAPIYACRAWVNFNGTGVPAIRASGNVSSITDNGTGDYTVNFTTPMPDADYCVNVTPTTANVTLTMGPSNAGDYAAGSIRVRAQQFGSGAVDVPAANISVFR